ncbi:hypothetical protein B0T10DRAFT_225130 [Thelonectria olida]|uniref:Uncharacterized protein n=1 Tax=Thelonectria olida TaxID=1576542 RepID=A0A9P9AUJ2_9HYPO|nr:hypothetical protein B0T10DRAFT_225130 [Thelonectria olida]
MVITVTWPEMVTSFVTGGAVIVVALQTVVSSPSTVTVVPGRVMTVLLPEIVTVFVSPGWTMVVPWPVMVTGTVIVEPGIVTVPPPLVIVWGGRVIVEPCPETVTVVSFPG